MRCTSTPTVAQYNAPDAVSKTRAPATYLRQVLVSAPVEMVWESTFVEVRPYGTSMSLGLLQLLDADCAARAEEGGRESTEEGSGSATKGGGTPKGGQYTEAEGDFDWVLCMGNFTARDEDVFVKVRRRPSSPSAYA